MRIKHFYPNCVQIKINNIVFLYHYETLILVEVNQKSYVIKDEIPPSAQTTINLILHGAMPIYLSAKELKKFTNGVKYVE